MENEVNDRASKGFDNFVDFGMRVRQADFADMVGVTQPVVSGLVTAGILAQDGTAGEWLLAYCYRLREQAAGRSSDGGLDLVQERAGLAREQRISQELKNGVTKREYAPVALLSEILASASQSVADQLNALPGTLKKVAPDMPEAARDAIDEVCRTARNNWVLATLNLEAKHIEDDESESDE